MARTPDGDLPDDRPGDRAGGDAPEPTATPSRPRTLLVESDIILAETLAGALAFAGYDCETAHTVAVARAALARVDGQPFGVLITDLALGATDGVALIQEARALGRYAALPAIVTTGDTSATARARVESLDRTAYLSKPYPIASLLALLASMTDETQDKA